MKSLIPALIKARAEFPAIPKNKVNPGFKSRYADLESILDAVTPQLGKNGLAIVQAIETAENNSYLSTTLYHASGELISSRYPLPNESNPQKMGSAITYARRYSLCALLSITADDDDDGNAASTKPQSYNKPPSRPQSNPTASPQCQALINQSSLLFEELGWNRDKSLTWLKANYKVSRRDELPEAKLKEMVEALREILHGGNEESAA